MKALLVTATHAEIEAIYRHFSVQNDQFLTKSGASIKILVAGVGMVATAYSLGRELARDKFDCAINVGIAGAFDRSLTIGEVVSVSLDCLAELGAEDGDDFIPIDVLGFGKASIKPIVSIESNAFEGLKRVKAITVNRVHGNDESIFNTVQRLNPQIETMEGAAFFFACNQSQVPCVQIRSISNYVARRNRDAWNIPLALTNLNTSLIQLLDNLQ